MEQIHHPKKVPLHPFKVNFSLVLNPATYNFSVPYNLAFSRMLYKWKNSAYTLLDLASLSKTHLRFVRVVATISSPCYC